MQLSEIIIQKIKKEGAISFRDFMEMALYYPNLGYYTSDRNKIGPDGDYYTSSSLTSAFGIMLGRQFEEMWEIMGRKEFTLVEYGAGTGLLCHDILDYLKENKPLYESLRYCIIEKSPVLCETEKTHLQERVSWYRSIQEIGPVNGCIFSNELLDNFAIHQVIMGDRLMEVFVDYQDEFTEVLHPASEELNNYFKEQKIKLDKGFRTEVNLQALKWIEEIAGALNQGFVLTIDYGYPAYELYSETKNAGTLICYHKHSVNENPYYHIGEQDITSHVNFSALNRRGLKHELNFCGFTNQSYFLRGLGFLDYLREIEKTENNNTSDNKGKAMLIQKLLIHMGSKLKVLIQSKGIPPVKLSGLKFPVPMTETFREDYA